jgi:O-antigen/teichoic acid export membrane protein
MRGLRLPALGAGARLLARDAGLLAGVNALMLLVRAGLIVVLTRALGAGAYGDYAYALSLSLLLLGPAQFGTNPAVTRDLGTASDPGAVVGVAALLRAVTAGTAAAGLAAWAAAGGAGGETALLVGIFAAGLAARSGAALFEAAHLGAGHGPLLARVRLRQILGEAAAVGGLAVLGAPLWALATAYALAWAWQLAALARRFGTLSLPAGAGARARRLAAEGAPIALAILCGQWLLLSPMLLMRGAVEEAAAFGQLALSVQVVVVLRMLPTALASAALPRLARAVARGDGRDARFLVGFTHLVWMAGGAGVLLAPAALPPLVTLLFGDAFAGAAGFIERGAWLVLLGALLSPLEAQALVHGGMRAFAALLVAASAAVWAAAHWPGAVTAPAEAMTAAAAALAGATFLASLLLARRAPALAALPRVWLLGAGLLAAAHAVSGPLGAVHPLLAATLYLCAMGLGLRAALRRRGTAAGLQG